MNHINKNKQRITEGKLRCEELVQHLERTESPKDVVLSEDASSLLRRITYDSYSNQLVGLVLPTNNITGMPKTLIFEANSAEAIEEYTKLPQSSLVYLIVAQPLKLNVPPFILCIYGTDNTFKKEDVGKRWIYTINELKR